MRRILTARGFLWIAFWALSATVAVAQPGVKRIALDWNDSPETDISYYNIYRSTTQGAGYSLVGSVAAPESAYTDENLLASVTYYYRVSAVDTSGNESLLSSEVDATTAEALENEPPIADAGQPFVVESGEVVTLDGLDSRDPDGDVVAYLWSQSTGSPVTITGDNSPVATFRAPIVHTPMLLVFDLYVWDEQSLQCILPDSVSVTVTPSPAPVAVAGDDQDVRVGETVMLDGSGSGVSGGEIFAYFWLQLAGPDVVFEDDSSSRTTFVAPAVPEPTSVTIQLVVWNTDLTTGTDTVEIGIHNDWPTADAGDNQQVYEGERVDLDGIDSSDPDGEIIAWFWLQAAGPEVLVDNADSSSTYFIAPDVDGLTTVTMELYVWDDGLTSDSATVDIGILDSLNTPPVADAGPKQNVAKTAHVTLDATDSSDADSDPLTFAWTQIEGPTVTLSNSSSPTPSFMAPNVLEKTTLTFELTASDGMDNDTDQVTIIVRKSRPRAP